MGKLEQTVFDLLAPSVEALGYELYGIEYLPQGKHSLLRIYIDTDSENGIQLEDCEKVSRQVSGILDVEDPLNGQYSLEVSSPGIERPLFNLEHFGRFIDTRVRIKLQQKLEGRKHITGLIKAVQDEAVLIADADDGVDRIVLMANVERAQLVPDWD